MNYGIRPEGFRLPDETAIGRVHLQVTDLARSSEFYESIVGLKVQSSEESTVVLGAGDRSLVVLHAGATVASPGKRLGLYHFAILLPDRPSLGRSLRRLLDVGIHPGASDHLVSEALYLQDPDNLGIEIYCDRPRSEWRTRGQELAMSSEPLDFNGVLSAAADSTWSAMPEGTTIGHVHLHVGELDRARSFYHQALGLDIVVWGYPGALFMSAGGYHHHLGLNTWAGLRAETPSSGEARLIEWELVLPRVEDVAAASDSLVTAGFSASPEEVGGSIANDPWGTAVRLKPRS